MNDVTITLSLTIAVGILIINTIGTFTSSPSLRLFTRHSVTFLSAALIATYVTTVLMAGGLYWH